VYDSASQRIATIDPLSNISTAVYSPNGSLVAVQNALGCITSYVLDGARQRICLVDANNERSSTSYDPRGLVSSTQDPLSAYTSFQFDAAGNTILRTDARNWPTSYTLDALNRTTQAVYIDGTRVTNSWDAAGQPLNGADVTGVYTYIWDSDSRKTVTQNPTGINLTATLDSVGNRLSQADPWGITTYSWDLQSRLLGILNPMNETTTIQWDPLSREQHRILGNGMAVSHTYDGAGREVLLENRNSAGVGQAIFTNSYDPLSNRLSVIELDNTRVSYSYDQTSQLLTESRSGTFAYNRSYVWDGLGNRLQQYDSGVLTQRTFNAANEMLTIVPASGSPTTQSFDPNGNLALSTTGSAVTTYAWSTENRLLSQVSPSVNEQYQYSQDGLRKEKIDASGTTQFTLDGQNVLLETTSSGVLQARNTQNPNGYGGLVSQNRSAASNYYGFDSQQSTRILVSVSGMITDSLSFKAFGEELQTGSGTANPFWFGGQVGYFRDLPGVMNVGQRKLVATNGVFLNRDLIGFAGGDVNLLRYVGNNPVVRIDPSGLAVCKNFSSIIPKCFNPVGHESTPWSPPAVEPGYELVGTDGLVASTLVATIYYDPLNQIGPSKTCTVGLEGVCLSAVTFDCEAASQAAADNIALTFQIYQSKSGYQKDHDYPNGTTWHNAPDIDSKGGVVMIHRLERKQTQGVAFANTACAPTNTYHYKLYAMDTPTEYGKQVSCTSVVIDSHFDFVECLANRKPTDFSFPQGTCAAKGSWSVDRKCDYPASVPASWKCTPG
jgi:RHS repeat-associated protein